MFAVAFTVYILMEKKMTDTVDKLTAAVTANTAAVNAAVDRITNIPSPGVDPAVVEAAAATIEANTAKLNTTLGAPVAPVEVGAVENVSAKGVSFSA
jgi:hypothetical protein